MVETIEDKSNTLFVEVSGSGLPEVDKPLSPKAERLLGLRPFPKKE